MEVLEIDNLIFQDQVVYFENFHHVLCLLQQLRNQNLYVSFAVSEDTGTSNLVSNAISYLTNKSPKLDTIASFQGPFPVHH